MSEQEGENAQHDPRNKTETIDPEHSVAIQGEPTVLEAAGRKHKSIKHTSPQGTPQGAEEGSGLDSQRTPRIHVPLRADAATVGSAVGPGRESPRAQEIQSESFRSHFNDYFGFPRPLTGEGSATPNVPLQDSPGHPLTIWKHPSPKSGRPPTSDPYTVRPVSVPNFPTATGTTQVEGQDNAVRYPDQTLASLGPRPQPPPPPTRMGRTRSSHSPQWSHSSMRESPSKETVPNHNGARTVGNTPAQSPGVQSPTVRSPPASRIRAPDSDDGRPGSSVLHASHLQEPIETHKLNKDIDPISGRKVLNNYELIEKLGSGQHGTVKRGRNLQTGDSVAVKIVRRASKKLRLGKGGDPNEMIKKEIAILKKARHPHVVSLYEVIDDPEYDKVYLVLEFVERGEIVWRKKTEQAIAQFERKRMNRELDDDYTVALERQFVNDFNDGVPSRRMERLRTLERQKCDALKRLESGKYHPRSDSHWSLDYGGESEQEAMMPERHDFAQEEIRMSRADVHAAENAGESPQSATPIYTNKFSSVSHVLNTDYSMSQPSSQPTSAPSSVPPSQPASQAPSRPETPSLDGTMYGPYVEENTKPNVDYRRILSEVINEQVEGWSLEDEEYRYVPCLTLLQALEAFRDTVLGIEYLHYHGIIHRDIKPANLLWTSDYRVKISDFGVSYLGKPIREDEGMSEDDKNNVDEALELAKTVGTPAFYAPELCDPDYFDTEKNLQRPPITQQIDVWALGVTLYGMVFGRLPFFDHNEFRMYEKIAHEEAFIPSVRLKGVSHNNKTPSDHNKRLEDVLEYEAVDDTLMDLLKRLLAKHPSQRITLKEVKHHPWVVSGIENKDSWLDETDPSRQNENKKIEVSNEEIQDAVIEISLVDKFVKGLQRLGSVMRGGRSRKRTTSSSKDFQMSSNTATARSLEDRRSSLRGDEQIFAALKQSREGTEHPLAHSVAASPDLTTKETYFPEMNDARPHSAVDISPHARPFMTDRSMSTADSMKTVTARDPLPRPSVLAPPQPASADELTAATLIPDHNFSTSSLGGMLGGAGRRLAKTFRSREGPLNRASPTKSSRSSSVDTNTNALEDYHASPSLGFSSAIAAGHVDLPPALREENEGYTLPEQSSADSFQRMRYADQPRHKSEYSHPMTHRRSVSHQPGFVAPPSPDDRHYHRSQQPRPASAAESSFAISSSSDQIVSGESAAHSRIPSVVSGASSVSAPPMDDFKFAPAPMETSTSSSAAELRNEVTPHLQATGRQILEATPALKKARAQQEEEAGYNGGEEQDSDSDDEGLAMA
ncbi:uncharacterized protein KY384_006842 [Bacidia gigantensis]|uniref:uncharacterized protein n=1 Tax=Bacidia gigantensis TaxID=2732470 RepID=UPI001D04B682|nr:uncharacterized protein KY384_006842 [Bacidia gigantensis]KAG8527926.1 hypothetical protein KY384_006842 [Bacidia gigantensis]